MEMGSMSFREKSAWISFVSLLIAAGIYFRNVARILDHEPAVYAPYLFVILVIAFVVVEVVLHLAIAMRSPKEARTPRDERERLIDLKATRIAFFVLLVGALATIGTMHIPGGGTWTMAHHLLLAIVVAELTKFGSQIVLYRRDA
jgi:hypothetical protein